MELTELIDEDKLLIRLGGTVSTYSKKLLSKSKSGYFAATAMEAEISQW